MGQIGERFRSALLGASDALLSFTTGVADQPVLQPVFLRGAFENNANLLHELKPFEMCISTVQQARPEWRLVPPLSVPVHPNAERQIRHRSREQYTRPKTVVEAAIRRFVGNS